MKKASVEVLVVAHKETEFPTDKMYVPIFVGKRGRELQERYGKERKTYCDNTGENIAEKNPYFSELTAMYWAWKNLKVDYVGLVHYRRYFARRGGYLKNLDRVLSREEVDRILGGDEIELILPKKRQYYIETMWGHYEHTLYPEPLEETEKIIREKYSEYVAAFEKLKVRRGGHMFNMLIAKKEIFDEYAEWLFGILFELERRVDATKYDAFHARFFGRISELLMDVYVETRGLEYKEVPFAYTERPRYAAKVAGVVKAKFGGKKYGESF